MGFAIYGALSLGAGLLAIGIGIYWWRKFPKRKETAPALSPPPNYEVAFAKCSNVKRCLQEHSGNGFTLRSIVRAPDYQHDYLIIFELNAK